MTESQNSEYLIPLCNYITNSLRPKTIIVVSRKTMLRFSLIKTEVHFCKVKRALEKNGER